jgi:hypothetical protein
VLSTSSKNTHDRGTASTTAAQQRQHEQPQRPTAGFSKYKRGYNRYDGTEDTDGGSDNSDSESSDSNSSSSDSSGSSSSNSDDRCSDSDTYYKEVARHAGLPRNMNDAAYWTEDDD